MISKVIIVVSMVIQAWISAKYGSYSWSFGIPNENIGNLI
jgi:type IV secretory pathway TrbD component